MMTALKAHWITALATLGVLFLWFIGIAFIADPDDGRQTVDVVFGTMFGLVGVGLLAGLWGLHTGRLPYGLLIPSSSSVRSPSGRSSGSSSYHSRSRSMCCTSA